MTENNNEITGKMKLVDVDEAWVNAQKKFFSDGPSRKVRMPVKESNIPDKYTRKIFLAKHKLSYVENNAYFNKLRETRIDVDRMELTRRADEVHTAIDELNRMARVCHSKNNFATKCRTLANKFSDLQKMATLAMNLIAASCDTKSDDTDIKSTEDNNHNPLNDF